MGATIACVVVWVEGWLLGLLEVCHVELCYGRQDTNQQHRTLESKTECRHVYRHSNQPVNYNPETKTEVPGKKGMGMKLEGVDESGSGQLKTI